MSDRLQRILDRQAETLARLQDQEARRFLRGLQDARRELAEQLGALASARRGETFTGQHLRVALAQVEAGIGQLQRRLDGVLSLNLQAQRERALEDLLGTLAAAEPDFRDAGRAIELAALARLSEDRALALHRHSLSRYGAQLIEEAQRQLVLGVTRAATWHEVTRRIAGARGSVLAGMAHRAGLIVRMEMNRTYNAAAQTSLLEAAETLERLGAPDPLMRRADESLDTRTHPLSQVLHGQVTGLRQPWRVSVAAVQAHADQARVSGVLWPVEGGNYIGHSYPAHFNERGRQVPWRASWAAHRGGASSRKGRWALPGVRSVQDPRVEVQLHENACGAACAVMLAADRGLPLDQAPLAATILTDAQRRDQNVVGPAGITASRLARELNTAFGSRSRWAGGGAPLGQERRILRLLDRRDASWAMLIGQRGREHWIVIDGFTATGRVRLRDPEGFRRYIDVDTLLSLWPSRQFVIEPK